MTTSNPNEFDELEQILTKIAESDQPIEAISLRYLFGRFTDLYDKIISSFRATIQDYQINQYKNHSVKDWDKIQFTHLDKFTESMAEFESRHKQVKLKLYKKLGVDFV